jgi:hypothetical protein
MRRLGLSSASQIGSKAHHVTAFVVGGEVSPSAGLHVHSERSSVPIGATWIASNPFVAFAMTVGQPPG